MTGLVRSAPCATCPMRGGFYLDGWRRVEIAEAVRGDRSFSCHSEVDYDVDGDDDHEVGAMRARECAGAVVLSLREGFANQIARIAFRLGEGEPDGTSVPFDGFDDWITEPEYSEAGTGRHGPEGVNP